MARGFGYLVAIIDLYSRKVLAHRLSNTMTTDFCVEALEEALTRFGAPEIFNTDQERSPGSTGRRNTASVSERSSLSKASAGVRHPSVCEASC